LTTSKLRDAIAAEFPGLPADALAYACRCHLPLVQVPPRGVWGRTAAVTVATLAGWIGDPSEPATELTIDDLVLRYLAAFGPATAADVTAWSRLPAMREPLERLRPRLVVVHDERGRELFDLPDAPRPGEDVGAPVRFLPEYDNVLLSHADRSRFHPAAPALRPGPGPTGSTGPTAPTAPTAVTAPTGPAGAIGATGPVKGTVLVDGVVHAIWRVERDAKAKRARLVVEHGGLASRDVASVEAEAQRVADFWVAAVDCAVEVRSTRS
jgi:hypothetical protein